MKYLNTKTIYGVETIDHLSQFDFLSYSEYRKELKRLINEYKISGISVYISQRATKDYNN